MLTNGKFKGFVAPDQTLSLLLKGKAYLPGDSIQLTKEQYDGLNKKGLVGRILVKELPGELQTATSKDVGVKTGSRKAKKKGY